MLLSTRDRKTPLFQEYLAAYDQIAADDLETSIQPTAYLQAKARRFYDDLGEIRGRQALEIGVGQGMLFEQLRAAGPAELYGIDIAASYLVRYIEDPGVSVAIANVENLPFAGQFDLAVASDVLEHVLSMPDALVSIHRALAPGGRLVLDLPYRENMLQYAKLLGCRYDMVHLRTFDRRIIVDLLRSAGFSVSTIAYDGFLAGRERSYVYATRTGGKLYEWAVRRRFGELGGVSKINRRLGRLLIHPVTIIVVATKESGREHDVVPPITYEADGAGGRSSRAPIR